MNIPENILALCLIIAVCIGVATCSYSALDSRYQQVYHERD